MPRCTRADLVVVRWSHVDFSPVAPPCAEHRIPAKLTHVFLYIQDFHTHFSRLGVNETLDDTDDIDFPYSVRNLCVIEVLVAFCVVLLLFLIFLWV